jgi:hypothetical protein
MIIQSQYTKDANTKCYKKLANVNVGISLKTEDCEQGAVIQAQYLSKYDKPQIQHVSVKCATFY